MNKSTTELLQEIDNLKREKAVSNWLLSQEVTTARAKRFISVSIERYNGQETYAAYLVLKEV